MTIARSLARAAHAETDVLVRPTADGRRSARVVGDRVTDRVGIVQVPNNVKASTPWRRGYRLVSPDTTLRTTTATGFIVRRNASGNVISVTFPDGTTRYPWQSPEVKVHRTTSGHSVEHDAIAAMLPAIGTMEDA
jgi:YD repeat-containing protein